jgi:hypothetical protein
MGHKGRDVIIVFISKRNPLTYGCLTLITMALGLLSRRYSYALPWWVGLYVGDVLWALMIFLIFASIFYKASTLKIAALSLVFSYGIEFSQLYQVYWINQLRETTLGVLVLGRGFLISDLICYTLGIAIAYCTEIIIKSKTKKG